MMGNKKIEEKIKEKDENGKVREAAALKYDPEKDGAPVIVALGSGNVAEKILEVANENQVPVYRDAELAHILSNFDVGDEIPPELYEIVAEILVFVSNIDKRFNEKRWIYEHGQK